MAVYMCLVCYCYKLHLYVIKINYMNTLWISTLRVYCGIQCCNKYRHLCI